MLRQSTPPPLVLTHGFSGSPGSWRDVRDVLRTRDAGAIDAVLLPGHEGRAAPTELGDALAVIDESIERSGSPVQLVGYSMGGRLALHYTLRFPARVHSLVLFGARPGLTEEKSRNDRRVADRALAGRLRREGIEAFMAFWENQPLLTPRTASPLAVQAAHRIRRSHDVRGLSAALEVLSVGALEDLWPRLNELRCPVTYAAGDHDPQYDVMMRDAASRTPSGRFVSIADAGHSVLLDSPIQVAEVILNSLPR